MTDRQTGDLLSLTVGEIRDAFKEELGVDHPVFAFSETPTPRPEDPNEFLDGGLQIFRQEYAKDRGRAGMLMSLFGAIRYIGARLPARELDRLEPLQELFRILNDLACNGNVAPSLRVTRKGNPDPDAIADVKARALAIAAIFRANAKLSREEADRTAAKLIVKAAHAVGMSGVDGKTIAGWRRNTRGRGKQNRPGDPYVQHLRKSLADRVEDLRDEILHRVAAFGCLRTAIQSIAYPDHLRLADTADPPLSAD